MIKFLETSIEETINNSSKGLLYFSIGLASGIVLFLISFLIIYILLKKKVKHGEVEFIDVEKERLIEEVNNAKKNYLIISHEEKQIKDKADKFVGIIINLAESIAKIYYPDSSEPLLEVSPERLIDFVSCLKVRVNDTFDRIVYGKYKMIFNIYNKNLKNEKLVFIYDIIQKSKENKEQKMIKYESSKGAKRFFSDVKDKVVNAGKKVGLSIVGKALDKEFLILIDDLSSDIIKLYSNQDINFRLEETEEVMSDVTI